jgi:hypothetical protein
MFVFSKRSDCTESELPVKRAVISLTASGVPLSHTQKPGKPSKPEIRAQEIRFFDAPPRELLA